MDKAKKEKILDYTFYLGIGIKGLDGIIETLSGFLLYFFGISTIQNITAFLTKGELSEDSNDLVANWLVNYSHQLSVSFKSFLAFYLLIHGVIKIFLVLALLRRKLWSYPVAIIFLFIFIIYQIYRLSYAYSIGLVLLTIFDIFIVFLVWHEYRKMK